MKITTWIGLGLFGIGCVTALGEPGEDEASVAELQACGSATRRIVDGKTQMSHSTGASTSDGWNVWTNGYVAFNHTFADEDAIVVRARGDFGGGEWPLMRVTVGGTRVGSDTRVDSATAKDFRFELPTLTGSREVRIAFLNDYASSSDDRNLVVLRAELGCDATCASRTYSAVNDMEASTGAAAGDDFNLWTTGTLRVPHDFTSAARVVVRARGQIAAGVWPRMRVRVGSTTLGERDVSSASLTDYAFDVGSIRGMQTIEVAFLNDYVGGGEDRNLLVRSVTARCGSGSPTPTPTPSACPNVDTLPRMRGVNLSGAEHTYAVPGCSRPADGNCYYWPENREIDYWAGKGANFVRIPFLWDRMQPTRRGALDSFNVEQLDRLVNHALSKNLYVLVDVHNYGEFRDDPIDSVSERDDFADLWRRIANRYSDCRVIFGLMNEPVACGGQCTLAMMNAGVKAIRDAGRTNAIFVTGLGYSGGHEFWNPWWDTRFGGPGETSASLLDDGIVDPRNNYAIEIHQYVDDETNGYNNTCSQADRGVNNLTRVTEWARAQGHRLFLGEFASPTNSACYTAANRMIDFTDDNTDVWMGWAYWAGGRAWGCYAGGGYDPQAIVSPHCGPGGWGDRPSTDNVLDRQGLR